MAKNAHTRGGGKWSTCLTRTGVCPKIGTKCYVSDIPFRRRPNPPAFGDGRVAKGAHDLGLTQIALMVAWVCQVQEDLLAGIKICWAPKDVLS